VPQNEEADLVWGAAEIARVINRDRSATYYMLSKGELPARKIAGRFVASKRRLLAFLSGEAAEAA